MKFIFFFIAITTCFPGITQQLSENNPALPERYLAKSEKKLKTARIFGWTAIGLTAGSAGLFIRSKWRDNHSDDMFAELGDRILSGGVGLVAAGAGTTAILLHTSSRKDKQKAAAITPLVTLKQVDIGEKRYRQPATGFILHF